MMRYLMLTCREATRLTEKKLNLGRLSLWDNLQLKLHLRACAHCQRYAEQSAAIESALKDHLDALEKQDVNMEGEPPILPEELREKMLRRLEQGSRP